MNNKLNFIITGATAAMLLLPMKTNAQSLNMGLRNSALTSASAMVSGNFYGSVTRIKLSITHLRRMRWC